MASVLHLCPQLCVECYCGFLVYKVEHQKRRMPYMLARRPMKRRRPMPTARRRKTPGYRNGVTSRTSQSANFRTGSRAIRPTAGLSSSVSSVFTTTTSGISDQPGGFQLTIDQGANGQTLWNMPASGGQPSGGADTCLTVSSTLNAIAISTGSNPAKILTFEGASVYESLYDFYRIDRVEIIIYVGASWVADGSIANPVVGGSADHCQPVICFAVDSNDNAPCTQQQLLSYANVQMKQCVANSPIQFSYKPAGLVNLGNVQGIQGSGPVFSPKIATSTPNVVHYGVKMVPMGLSATPTNYTSVAGVSLVIRQYVTFFDRRST